jgi:predicted  nucleic acid-binding Zn-ribbon protein
MALLNRSARNAVAKPFAVSSLHDASPGYAEAKALTQRLVDKVSALEREDDDLRHRLNNTNSQDRAMNSRVAELLGDEVDEANPEVDGIHARLKQNGAERRDLRTAIDVARDRMSRARFDASRTICAEVEPEYRARVKALAEALAAAHRAHADVVSLLGAIDAADVARPVLFDAGRALAMLGLPNDPHSRLAAWFRETAAAGLIEPATVPKEFV